MSFASTYSWSVIKGATVEPVPVKCEAVSRCRLRTLVHPRSDGENIRADLIGAIRRFMRGLRVLRDGALDASVVQNHNSFSTSPNGRKLHADGCSHGLGIRGDNGSMNGRH